MQEIKYKEWSLFDEMPSGWKIDKTCGSPLTGYVFIINKSVLSGGKRALLRARQPQQQICFDNPTISKTETVKAPKKQGQVIDENYVRTVNELARQKFKQRMLNDILIDLMICEIEGWAKIEYINEMKRLINSIASKSCIDA